MTKDEAKKIEAAARKWLECACEYDIGILLNDDSVPYSDVMQQEQAFLALLNSMIEDTQIAVNDATKVTYITRCPACHAKIDWVEFEATATAKTLAELAAENAQCNAAYLAKKTE